MAEENQVQQEPQQVTTKEPQQVQQVTTKEPQQVATKDPKKIEAGRRLAAHNRKKREVQKKNKGPSRVRQYYSIGAVLAMEVIGGLGYYIYQTKQPSHTQPNSPPKQPSPQTNKFKMD